MCVSLEVPGPVPGAMRWLCRFQKPLLGPSEGEGMDCWMDVFGLERWGRMRCSKKKKRFQGWGPENGLMMAHSLNSKWRKNCNYTNGSQCDENWVKSIIFYFSLHPIPLLLVLVFFKEFHPLVPECLSPRLSELNVTLCASSGPVVSSAEKSLALEIVDYTKLIRVPCGSRLV